MAASSKWTAPADGEAASAAICNSANSRFAKNSLSLALINSPLANNKKYDNNVTVTLIVCPKSASVLKLRWRSPTPTGTTNKACVALVRNGSTLHQQLQSHNVT